MSRRPQPVLAAAQASAIATWAVAVLVGWLDRRGWLLPDGVAEPLAELLEVGIVAGASAVSGLLAARRARDRVTPLADPRDDDGGRLIRLRTSGPAARPPAPRPAAAHERAPAPAGAPTEQITRPVDVGALRREYGLD